MLRAPVFMPATPQYLGGGKHATMSANAGGFDPSQLSGTMGLLIDFSKTRTLFKDAGYLTIAEDDTDTILGVRDLGDMTHKITVGGASAGGVLSSDSVMGSFGDFPGAGTNLQFLGSNKSLRHLHTNKTWDLVFWVYVDTLQACTFFDSCNRTTGGVGIYIDLTVGGNISSSIVRGTGGQTVYTKTTTATLPTDDWVMIRIKREVDTAPTIQLFTSNGTVAGSVETYTAGAGSYVAAGTDSTEDLVFGSRANNATLQTYDDGVALIALKLDALFSDDDIENLRAWRAPRSLSPYCLKTRGSYATLGSQAVSGVVADWDMSDTSKMWQDSVGGTAADDATERIGVVETQYDGVADSTLNRAMTASGDARPTYVAAATTGLDVGGAQWDGVTPNSLDIPTGAQYAGTQTYWLLLCRNTKGGANATGSRFLSHDGSKYFVVTSNDYRGTGGDDTRAVVHTGDTAEGADGLYGNDGGVTYGEEFDGEDWNLWEILRDDDQIWIARNGNDGPKSTNTGTWNPQQMGDSEVELDWDMKGEVVRSIRMNGLPNAAQRAILRDGVASDAGFTL